MRILPIAAINVPSDRQRREFEPQAMQDLADSIIRIGLMQPIVVRYDELRNASLVAGERRLRALVDLGAIGASVRFNGASLKPGEVPTIDIGELSEERLFEAELEENIRRAALTWQEEASARAALHELRRRQSPGHTVQQTAIEVFGKSDGGYQDDKLRKQITVAAFLSDPDVARAKDAKEAYKILERKEQVKENVKLATLVGESYGAHSHTLLKGDCLEVMAGLPDHSFDVICTDPPYGMGADSFGDAAGKLTTITHGYDDSLASFEMLMIDCAMHWNRIAKPSAHLYICCDIDQFPWLRKLLSDSGWSVFRTPLINVKQNSGRVPLPEHGPRRTYETILYAFRGRKRVTGIYPDVITSSGDENLGHGAQKPVALIADLLKRSVKPGDRVLDPFAGTGTIFPAAHAHRCYATGIERDDNSYGIAAARLAALDEEVV